MQHPFFTGFIALALILGTNAQNDISQHAEASGVLMALSQTIIPFESLLYELTDSDSIQQFQALIDSVRDGVVAESRDADPFTLSDSWTLACYHVSGWREQLPHQREIIRDFYLNSRPDSAITGADIFREFGLPDSASGPLTLLTTFPQVHHRNDPFNGRWTAIRTIQGYLVLRRVHSYPNGNQTSWYIEDLYVFRKLSK